MDTINSQISIILVDLISSIKDNNLEQAKILVNNLNQLLPNITEENVNLKSLFSVELLNIKNETLIYILENLPSIFPSFVVWDVRYNFLMQGFNASYAENWINSLIQDENLNNLSLGEIKQLFEICIKYQKFDLMQKIRNSLKS